MSTFLYLSCFLALAFSAVDCSFVSKLPYDSQEIFNASIKWLDMYYDGEIGYLYKLDGQSALHHETRSSVWYAVGLLARNQSQDAAKAVRIIKNVVSGQYKDPNEQWFGDYQQEPEEPYVGSVAYPPKIYGSWDPNWRGFVGTTFIVMLEEFGDLIDSDTTQMMLESLRNATIGDSYRVGGVDGDNLYPAYTNPALMRAFVAGYTGRRLSEPNMTASGEQYAREIVELFNRANTLSEFNSGTYTGVSLFALTLWSKYLPAESIMTENGPRMINATWRSIAQLWHPQLRNMAGPWDRSYGFDMNRYFSLMALHLWTLIGREGSSLISKPQIMSHSPDYAWGPLIAILSPIHNALIPKDIRSSLGEFLGEHTFTSSTFSSPFDYSPRNITAWLADGISIGAESFDENIIGGPAKNQETFNPAVVQWNLGNGGGVGFISLYATEPSLQAAVQRNQLSLTYPNGNSSSIFSFVVSTISTETTISSWGDIPGLNVTISGNVDMEYNISFAGLVGGQWETINDFEFWNFTYRMPQNLEGTPRIQLDLALKP